MCIIEDFKDIMSPFVAFEPHMVLLDISLPYYNGYHWCSEIRKISKVPIVFISSTSDNLNIVMAMDMGADDFISKPFSPRELVLRVKNILRRIYGNHQQSEVLTIGDLVIDQKQRLVMVDCNTISLTNKSFDLLWILANHLNRVFSKTELRTALHFARNRHYYSSIIPSSRIFASKATTSSRA